MSVFDAVMLFICLLLAGHPALPEIALKFQVVLSGLAFLADLIGTLTMPFPHFILFALFAVFWFKLLEYNLAGISALHERRTEVIDLLKMIVDKKRKEAVEGERKNV